jgi:filamentous hemagglutinin
MQALAGSQTAPLLALHAKPNAEAPSLAELARQIGPQAAVGQASSADASAPASDPHAGNPGAAAPTASAASSLSDLSSHATIGSATRHVYKRLFDAQGDLRSSLDGINPHYVENAMQGVNTNCVSCALALYDRVTGRNPRAVAGPSPSKGYAEPIDLYPVIGTGFRPEPSLSVLESDIRELKDGSVGFVLIEQKGGMDHVINYVLKDGRIHFIDAQLGKEVELQENVAVSLGIPFNE